MDIHEGYLLLENADFTGSNFGVELNNFEKGTKRIETKSFFI